MEKRGGDKVAGRGNKKRGRGDITSKACGTVVAAKRNDEEGKSKEEKKDQKKRHSLQRHTDNTDIIVLESGRGDRQPGRSQSFTTISIGSQALLSSLALVFFLACLPHTPARRSDWPDRQRPHSCSFPASAPISAAMCAFSWARPHQGGWRSCVACVACVAKVPPSSFVLLPSFCPVLSVSLSHSRYSAPRPLPIFDEAGLLRSFYSYFL